MAQKVLAVFEADATAYLRTMAEAQARTAQWETGTLTSLGHVEKGVNALATTGERLSRIGEFLAVGFGVNIVTEFIDKTTKIHNALREIGADSETNFHTLYLASTRAVTGMEPFAESVAKWQKSLGDTQGFDTTVRQIETLDKLMALSGKSAEEKAAVINALNVAIQKGELQGRDIRTLQVGGQVDLLREMARELGTTTDQLAKFGKQGKITTAIILGALDNLKAETDARMKDFSLTFGDAMAVMQNGAVMAAASFDQGSGLSRAATGTLKMIGTLLGQSADAFRVFGQAAEIAAAIFAARFAAGKFNAATAAVQNFYTAQTQGVKDAYAATIVAQNIESEELAKKQATTAAIRAKVAALQEEGASEKAVAAAMAQLAKAETGETAVRLRFIEATVAATAAEERLSAASRATVAAGGLMRGAWAFMGGWPGMILLAGAALLTMVGNARTLDNVLEAARTAIGDSKSAVSDLKDVQDRLNQALADAGTASDAAHAKIMANTMSELLAKRALLEIETTKLAAQQKEEELQANNLQTALKSAQANLQASKDELANLTAQHFDSSDTQVIAMNADIRKFGEEITALNPQIDGMNAQLSLTRLQLDANNTTLSETAALFAKIEGERALAAAADQARTLKGWLDGAAERMGQIQAANIDTPIGRAAAMAQSLFGWLSKAAAVVIPNLPGSTSSLSPLQVYDLQGKQNAAMAGRGLPSLPASSGGGSGGGGASQTASDWKTALSFIDQTMTAQEQQAKQLADILDLRQKIVATYGEESPQVAQLDVAIGRFKDQMDQANQATTDLFTNMSNSISSSIQSWTGWGDMVRSILSNLVQAYGPAFFTALLTPGKQTGGDMGTLLGNLVTGFVSGGSGAGSIGGTSAIGMSTLATPSRLNMSAVNQTMQAVRSSAAPSVTVVNQNDFRGVDLSTKASIEAQLAQRDRQFNGKVVAAVVEARRRRVPV